MTFIRPRPKACVMQGNAAVHPQGDRLNLEIVSNPMAVRAGLSVLLAAPLFAPICSADRGTAEIVLAEAMNNIVEHAYATKPGTICLTLSIEGDKLLCQIEDHGLPMPGETMPLGKLRDFDGRDDLPEGGFGWHLIRTLSHDLSYERRDLFNLLRFRLDARQSEP